MSTYSHSNQSKSLFLFLALSMFGQFYVWLFLFLAVSMFGSFYYYFFKLDMLCPYNNCTSKMVSSTTK